jgi:autotransporter-associated beta strand protein
MPRSWFRGLLTSALPASKPKQRPRGRCASGTRASPQRPSFKCTLEPLEDRITPVIATFPDIGHLHLEFEAAGEKVTVANDGVNLTVTEGATSVHTVLTATITQLSVSDPSDSPDQTITFSGPILLDLVGGLSTTGVESVELNAPITTTVLSIDAESVNSNAAGAIVNSISATFNVSGPGELQGPISGLGSVTKTGPGMLAMAGSNSYLGGTNIDAGVVIAQSNSALGVGTATISADAMLCLQGDITLDVPISAVGSGVGGAGAISNLSDNNTLSGPITLTGNTTLGAEAGGLTLTGAIDGVGNITAVGTGRIVFANTNAVTGVTHVAGDALSVNGILNTAVNVYNGGTLRGSGKVGRIMVKSGGTLAPGNSPGKLESGDLVMYTGATLKIDIDGTIVGAEYDQVNVIGAVNLNNNNVPDGGATLDVTVGGGFTPVPGNSFIIINNDGVDPVSGTFLGLLQGALFSANGFTFNVDYAGGDGNDVVLTAVADLATTTTLVATPQHTTGGALIMLTATVSPFPGAAPFGDVTFSVDGSPFPDGSNVPLSAEGTAVYTWATTASTPLGPHLVGAEYNGAPGFLTSFDTETVTIDEPAVQPQVTGLTVNGGLPSFLNPDGQSQFSRVVNLVIVFDQAVQLDPGAMTIALHTLNVAFDGVPYPDGYSPTSNPMPTLNVVPSAGNTTWTVTFSGNAVIGGDGFNSLRDGVYDLTIHADKVHPDGSPNVNMAADSTTVFHCLFGDTNPPTATPNPSGGTDYQAVVNTGDNIRFRGALNIPIGYRPYLDYTGNGLVNSGDNLQFRGNLNHSLTWTV